MSVDRLIERLLFLGIIVLACLMPVQNDTWWHLRAGYEMLSSRTVMVHDVFSHSVFGQYWENHAWLSQVTFATLHRLGGLPLLTATCAVAITWGMWLVYVSTPGSRIQRMAVLAASVSGATITWSVRPQSFTLLLLGGTIWLVSRERWALLPVLFLVWANLHSAVGLGLVVLGGAAAGHLIAHRRVPPRLAVVIALCGLATLLTPQGLAYWPNIATSMQRSRVNTIAEWRPPDWPPAHLVFWVAAAALPALTFARRRRLTSPVSWGHVCGALMLLPVAFASMRNISPFLMAAAPAAGVLLAEDSHLELESGRAAGRRVVYAAIFWAACLASALAVRAAWINPPPRMGWHPVSPDAARAIEGCRGPLYNTYVDGGPIIFFAPGQRVLLDSRQDPYPVELVQAEGQVERTGDYEGLFARYGINCAAVPPGAPVRDRLERDGWIRRFADDQWIVLERPW